MSIKCCLLALVLFVLGGTAALAEDQAVLTMDVAALGSFVDRVAGTVGQDSLKMRDAGAKTDCLALIGLSNGFALGYGYLADAARRAGELGDAAIAIKAKVIQARVLTFAARIRAEEWLQSCTGFTVTAEQAADPRYAAPVKVAPAAFAEAAADLRDAAAINLAGAVGAATAKDCKRVVSAAEALALFLPYLDKFIVDLGRRPEAQGPRTSLTGLRAVRAQVAGASQSLETEFRPTCSAAPAP